MNLSTERKAQINEVLNDRVLGWLYPVFETGKEACRSFMNLNSGYFDCEEYLNLVPGNLLTYSINKQLKKQCELITCPFTLCNEIVNDRNKYCIPVLKISNLTLSIIRSTQKNQIGNSERKYLQSKCKNNQQLDGQFSLFDEIGGDQFHGVILYSAKDNDIGFAEILFFDEKLRNIYHSIDLIERLHIFENSMDKEEKKKTLLDADNIIKEFKTLGG